MAELGELKDYSTAFSFQEGFVDLITYDRPRHGSPAHRWVGRITAVLRVTSEERGRRPDCRNGRLRLLNNQHAHASVVKATSQT